MSTVVGKKSEALTFATTCMNPETCCSVRSQVNKAAVWFHVCELSRTGKSTETGSGVVAVRGGAGRGRDADGDGLISGEMKMLWH